MSLDSLRSLSDADAPVAVRWARHSLADVERNVVHLYRIHDGRLHQHANSTDEAAVAKGVGFDPEQCFVLDGEIWVPSPGPMILITRIHIDGPGMYAFANSTASLCATERLQAIASMRVSMLDLDRKADGLQQLLGTNRLEPIRPIGDLEILQDGIDTTAAVSLINTGVVLQQQMNITDAQSLKNVDRRTLDASLLAHRVVADMDAGIPMDLGRMSEALDAMRPVIEARIEKIGTRTDRSRSNAAETRELQRKRRHLNLLVHRDIVDFVHGEASLDRSMAPELSELKL